MSQRPDRRGASRAVPLICFLAGLFMWFVSSGVNDYGVILGLCLALGGGVYLMAPSSWRQP